ncbi:MAG: putative viral replication protein [Atripovirus timinis]|uniref:Viral replication protein n=1 Tax=Cressdnaviricota sp. TaxID=2748378 RepID=A0A345MXV8_9VIRU|nr:MAG: putative viral replication protein [Cressdnaviricota sp.]
MSQSKVWCFTLNNPTDDITDRVRAFGESPGVEYLIFGKEVGDSGTPHLQGFIKYKERQRMSGVKIDIGANCHVEVARNVPASVTYCKKDGDFEEFGALVGGQGKRKDIDLFKEDVKAGMLDLKAVREKHSMLYARCARFCYEYIQDNSPIVAVEAFPLRDWQQELNAELLRAPVPRKVKFIVDVAGNSGKTWFAHYYCSLHENAQILLPGKKADMAFCLRTDVRVVFIDAPRAKQGDFLQYDFLEEVKNGFVFSSKYESRVKRLNLTHLVVFMNETPDLTKLSLDRYDIVNV